MENIKTLLDRFETLKAKGLRLGVADLADLIDLMDEMQDTRLEKESEYIENKNELDNKKAIRYEELKAETEETQTAKGESKTKSKYTDEGCKSVIKQEFTSEDNKLSIQQAEIKLLGNKLNVIEHYINLCKILIKS